MRADFVEENVNLLTAPVLLDVEIESVAISNANQSLTAPPRELIDPSTFVSLANNKPTSPNNAMQIQAVM